MASIPPEAVTQYRKIIARVGSPEAGERQAAEHVAAMFRQRYPGIELAAAGVPVGKAASKPRRSSKPGSSPPPPWAPSTPPPWAPSAPASAESLVDPLPSGWRVPGITERATAATVNGFLGGLGLPPLGPGEDLWQYVGRFANPEHLGAMVGESLGARLRDALGASPDWIGACEVSLGVTPDSREALHEEDPAALDPVRVTIRLAAGDVIRMVESGDFSRLADAVQAELCQRFPHLQR